MLQTVYEFFGIIGVPGTPPATLAELIPYLLQVIVGLVLVVAVFKTVGAIASAFMDWRRWR